MPTLTISRVSSTKQRVTIAADDGATLELYDANLMSPRAQKRLVDATGLPAAQIAAAAAQVLPKDADPVEIPFAAAGAVNAAPFELRIRGKDDKAESDTTLIIEASSPAQALLQAFAVDDFGGADPIIEWQGRDRLCCLDIDYHSVPFDARPAAHWLEMKAAAMQPRPFAFHTSHGRGTKLFYTELPGFTARELAAVAAVGWLTADVRATADFVRQTRHPRYASSTHSSTAGPVHTQTPDNDLVPIGRWLQRSVDPFAVEDWLSARGWQRGQKLPHTECLIDPCESHGEPVYVGDDGIFCHRCAAAGRSLGRTPGYTPWSGVVGGFPPRAACMLANATHWAHARLILRNETRMNEATLREAYSAALKLTHGPDSPQVAAMQAGADVIRMPGRWVSPDGATTYTNSINGMISSLPATWLPGTREVLPDRRDLFMQAADLSHYGYPAVTPVHGATVYGQFLPYPDDRVSFAVPASWCRDPRFAPRYRPKAERMKLDDATALVESVLPGIHWPYVRLLIALKGLAEGMVVQAPFAIVTGPSGAGKSNTVQFAASVCGDVCSDTKFVADGVRLIQAVAEGLDKGSFVVFDEVFKEADRAKLKPRAAVDPILNMTPGCLAHRMYIGPRPLGRLPALVLTDINIPSVVQSDVQLARRLVWVNLPHRVDWDKSVAGAGFGSIGRFRLWSPEAAAACDAVLSDTIDRFFRHPMTTREIATELGFGSLEDAGGVADVREQLKKFFGEVCDAPDLTGAELQRFPGGGWKCIDRGDTSAMRDVWDEIADGVQGEEWGRSRIAEAEDWSRLLGVTQAVQFERGTWRGKTFVRFRVGGSKVPLWVSAKGVALPK
jgi:hypothetical protein